jgi:predicted nuclease of restriction endonuclease-like (RecB) superfamily
VKKRDGKTRALRLSPAAPALAKYEPVLAEVSAVLNKARHSAAQAVNASMTAAYWNIGRIVTEYELNGAHRAGYGETLVERLAADLTIRFGRGFSRRNLDQMRAFYRGWPIRQTASAKSERQLASAGLPDTRAQQLPLKRRRKPQTKSALSAKGPIWQTVSAEFIDFPLPWSHYVLLLAIENTEARGFYETEALRGGWTVRQLKRQIASQFYERTALSRNKAAMLRSGQNPKPGDALAPEEAIKDPLVLEFLDLKDEYSESDLEQALIGRLEHFLLELGGDFAFIGRQRRLRVGDAWYRIDLLFFHRRLRCLVIIDLKLGELTHADAGQMHLYLNYAREHWTHEGENPPVGLIVCAKKDAAVAKYALEGLPNKVLAAEYRTTLPNEKRLAEEIAKTRRELEARKSL